MVESEKREVFNFSAGPCILPKEVMQKAADEMLDWHGSGVSVLEMSHRSKEFIAIAEQAEKDLRDLMSIPTNFKIFFLQGGASLQFSAVVYNMLGDKAKATYITTGAWSQLAFKEA